LMKKIRNQEKLQPVMKTKEVGNVETGKTKVAGNADKDKEVKAAGNAETGKTNADKVGEEKVENVEAQDGGQNGVLKEQKLFLFPMKFCLEPLDRPSSPRLNSKTTLKMHTSLELPSEAFLKAEQEKCLKK